MIAASSLLLDHEDPAIRMIATHAHNSRQMQGALAEDLDKDLDRGASSKTYEMLLKIPRAAEVLEDLGVEEAADMGLLDDSDIWTLARMLKKVQAHKLTNLFNVSWNQSMYESGKDNSAATETGLSSKVIEASLSIL